MCCLLQILYRGKNVLKCLLYMGSIFHLNSRNQKMFLLFWLGTVWMKLKGGSIACALVAIEDMELQYLL